MELMENGACNLQYQSYTKSVTLGKIPSEYCCHKTFQGTARLESLVIVQQRKTQTFDAILLLKKKRAQFGRQHTHIKGIKDICNMENWISSQCFTFLPHEYVCTANCQKTLQSFEMQFWFELERKLQIFGEIDRKISINLDFAQGGAIC